MRRLYVCHHPYPLDEPLMLELAPLLEGEHDFSAFAAADEKDALGASKVRRIDLSRFTREGDELVYRITGSGFLKHMVRMTVGTLVEAGKGNLTRDDLLARLRPGFPGKAGPALAASGTMLDGCGVRTMKRKTATLFLAAALGLAAAPPIPVIFDTDMGNDVDDALALAMLHSLQSRGEIHLLAVTVTKHNPWAPRFVSAVNTFYGRAAIPIGMVSNGVTRDDGKYARQAIEKGRYAYTDRTSDAVELLEKTLTAQPDASVIVIQVGFSTNLARLLERPGGTALVAKKVKLLSLMAGDFTNAGPEYNVKEDVPSAKKLVAAWPTPTLWSGFEVGRTIKFPARSIEHDFAWAPRHPVVDGYKAYMKFPYDRETWDLTAVLAALRPAAGYFTLSEPGRVVVDDRGMTRLEPAAGGRDRYLTVNDQQRARVLEALIWLSSEPAR